METKYVIFRSEGLFTIVPPEEWEEMNKNYRLPTKTIYSALYCFMDDRLYRALEDYTLTKSAQIILQQYWSEGLCI